MKRFGRVLFFLLCATWLPILEPALADPPAGVPTANTNIPGLVPAPLAQKIALRHAQDTWGQVALGPSFVCADDDGDIVAYAFTVAIGKSSFPTSGELSSYLRYGRDVAERGFEAMSEADQQGLEATIAGKALAPQPAAAPGLPPRKKFLVPETPSAWDEAARDFGKQKMIGAGGFGTVVVSARYDRFPIPYYSNHLSTYLYNGDVAEKKAAAALSANDVSLARVYFIERQGMFFEFSSANGNVLMHSGDLVVLPVENVLKRKGKKVIPVPEAQARITAEWDKVKNGVGE
jgi:hypothetical protein